MIDSYKVELRFDTDEEFTTIYLIGSKDQIIPHASSLAASKLAHQRGLPPGMYNVQIKSIERVE